MAAPTRKAIAIGIACLLFAGVSVAVLKAIESMAGLIFMDMTSVLRRDGTMTDQQWDELCDRLGQNLPQAFVVGWTIPVTLAVVGIAVMVSSMRRRPVML